MPALSADSPLSVLPNSTHSSFDQARKSHDKTISGVFTYTNGTDVETGLPDHRLEQIKSLRNGSQNSLTNGVNNARTPKDRLGSSTGSNPSLSTKKHHTDYFSRPEPPTRLSNVENSDAIRMNGDAQHSGPPTESSVKAPSLTTDHDSDFDFRENRTSRPSGRRSTSSGPRNSHNLVPSAMTPIASADESQIEPIRFPPQPTKLEQRHTLSIPPTASSAVRGSKDFSFTSGPSEEGLQGSERFSPTRDHDPNVRRRRASLGLVRRTTRPTSDAQLEEVIPDEDAARWTEAIRQKRASRRRRQEEDEERVIVGKKVEEGHVNWVTAYNMLTGIRFTVSRTNAKMDRELTDADFDTKHKMSFDVTGSELTPSAKYDFKFKDYAPWVFRHLRQIFGLDPADYLMSLTSKYILSELGSPGKSGSFFYFSRDYKYIIKTIHHAEHKLLRKILRDYYAHVKTNPDTLISQFYGLHRVKIAYGRKIHFVVMNNLFPPHRDIHQTFDLKGSTIGRDFKEENLESNPRATLKDLNWLRRDKHLEFDPRLRDTFIEQLQRDVALLQRLHIMDYSLLVGMHDVEKGNDENVRAATLQVFQPGGREDDEMPGQLMRTPSRLESARKARALRQHLATEKPRPMNVSSAVMPEQLRADDQRHNKTFYSDDGGIRATHEDGQPGETIYYLGVIDCLTHYGLVKRAEHFWKGLSHNSQQISPIPPHGYGERFLNFMTGITMTKEEAERRPAAGSEGEKESKRLSAHNSVHHHHIPERPSRDGMVERCHSPRDEKEVEKTLAEAEKSVDKQTGKKGRRRSEEEKPDRTLGTHTNDARISTTLPIVQEVGENGSRNSSRRGGDSPGTKRGLQKEEKEEVEKEKVVEDDERGQSDGREEGTAPTPEGQESKMIEYTVTDEDHPFHHERREDEGHVEAPLEASIVQEDDMRRAKAPRIESGIIPTMTPLYSEEEIGIAK